MKLLLTEKISCATSRGPMQKRCMKCDCKLETKPFARPWRSSFLGMRLKQLQAHGDGAVEETLMATPSNVPVSDEFSGKRVLVTGGTQGAGKAIAVRFKRGSATVIVAARS